MSKPKIRKALFIGMGGTGALTLLQLKKRFFEVYGHVDENKASFPEFVKFLVLDTDKPGVLTMADEKGDAVNATTGKSQPIRFNPDEVIHVKAKNSGDLVLAPANEELFKGWVPLENRRVLETLENLNEGAGQIRLFGRLAFFFNAQKIRAAIESALNEVLRADHEEQFFQPLEAGSVVDIHLVGSLAGGTGSGMFMDTAFMIREILENEGLDDVKINGYFVLPGIFIKQLGRGDKTPRVLPNAHAALKELDFFMEFKNPDRASREDDRMSSVWDPEKSVMNESDDKKELAFEYMDAQVTRLKGRPFDSVFLVDATNEENGTFKEIAHLTESVSKALFANCTSIYSKLRSQDNNNRDRFTTFQHKKGWVGSIGISELIYSLPEVQKHMALRAAEDGLLQLLAPSPDMSGKASTLLKDLGLYEAGEESDLVTRLENQVTFTSKQLFPEDVAKVVREAGMTDVRNLYPRIEAEADKILAKAAKALSDVDGALPDLGRANARVALLESFGQEVSRSRIEVKNDLIALKEQLKQEEEDLFEGPESTEKTLERKMSAGLVRRLLGSAEIKELRATWESELGDVMKTSLKAECMRHAERILGEIESVCATVLRDVSALNQKLDSLKAGVSNMISTRRSSGISELKPTPFIMNLHSEDMERPFKPLESAQWSAGEFMKASDHVMNSEDKIEVQVDDICKWIVGQDGKGGLQMAELQDLVPDSSGSRLNRWLLEMLRDAQGVANVKDTKIGKYMSNLIKMSSPMFNVSGKEVMSDALEAHEKKTVEGAMKDVFMICVPSNDVEKAMKDIIAGLQEDGQDFEFTVAPDQQDRVTVFRRMVGAPVFALSDFGKFSGEYMRRHKNWESTGELFHANYNWFSAMEGVGFSLTEGASMSEEYDLEMWTTALLLGIVKWDPARKAWISQADGELGTVRNKDRHEIFDHLMEDNDFGQEIERQVKHRIQNVDPKALKTALSQYLWYNEDSDRVELVDDPENAIPNSKKWTSAEHINPYEASRTSSDIYGVAAYNRLNQKLSLDLLKKEVEILKSLYKKEVLGK